MEQYKIIDMPTPINPFINLEVEQYKIIDMPTPINPFINLEVEQYKIIDMPTPIDIHMISFTAPSLIKNYRNLNRYL